MLLRHLIALFIIINIMVITGVSCDNQNNKFQTYSINVNCIYNLFDFSIDNEFLYVLDKENLNIYKKDGKKESTINNMSIFGSAMAIHNNYIYIYDTGIGVKVFNLDGTFIKTIDVNKNYFGRKIQIKNNIIYMLVQNLKDNRSKLTMYDIKKDSLKDIDINIYNATNFCKYKNNAFLMFSHSSDGYKLIEYDIVNEKVINEYKFNSVINDIIYDEEINRVIYSSQNYLKSYDLKSGKINTLEIVNKECSLNKISNYNNYYVVSDIKNNQIHFLSKNKNKETLKIITHVEGYENEIRMNKAIEKFSKEYPSVKLDFESHPYEKYFDFMLKKVMAGDDDYDIFTMNDMKSFYYIKNDVMYDLSNNKNIEAYSGKWFDGVANNCSYNEKIIGVPEFLVIYGWEVNEELINLLDIDCPSEFWTWEDFYQYSKVIREKNTDAYSLLWNKKFPPFLSQYNAKYVDIINKKVNYNNDLFISLLELWKKIWDQELITDDRNNSNKVIFNNRKISLVEGQTHLAYPPSISKEPIYESNYYLLCVNKKSLNTSLATELLSFYISPEIQTAFPETGSAIYKNLSIYKEPDTRFSSKLSHSSNYNIFANIMKYSKPRQFNIDIFRFTGDIIEQFMNDEFSAKQAAIMIEEKARMLIEE